jgi:hypothetical protein
LKGTLLRYFSGEYGAIWNQTVPQVVHYELATHECASLSTWGKRGDWFQNTLAQPPFDIQTSSELSTPQYRRLVPNDGLTTLRQYEKRYRCIFRAIICDFGYQYDGSEASLALEDMLLLVAFRPRGVAPR